MTTSNDETTVERAAPKPFDDLNARDFSNPSYWGPDTVYTVPSVGALRGREQIVAYFEEMLAALPDLVMEVERVLQDGRFTVVQWNVSGTFTGGRLQGLESTGGRLTFRGCDVIESDGDKIRSNTVYFDSAALARQIGMLPPEGSMAEKATRAAFNVVTRIRRRFS